MSKEIRRSTELEPLRSFLCEVLPNALVYHSVLVSLEEVFADIEYMVTDEAYLSDSPVRQEFQDFVELLKERFALTGKFNARDSRWRQMVSRRTSGSRTAYIPWSAWMLWHSIN
jgi:hypothetical protein